MKDKEKTATGQRALADDITFSAACDLIEATIAGDARRSILAELRKSASYDRALERLREGLRTHVFDLGSTRLRLREVVDALDERTCQDGFHVLHDWDGKLEKLNPEIIPVDVLDYLREQRGSGPYEPVAPAILLDYYFLYLLALLCLRAWDEGDPNANLARLTAMIGQLQSSGSGQVFVSNAESLIFVATSHFEPDETAYDRLLERVRALDAEHRINASLTHASILASHLRFGLEAAYGRDVGVMRDDNGPDYPWLSFAVGTLMRAYADLREGRTEGPERERIVEGLANGLTPDARAFMGPVPGPLAGHEAAHREFQELFSRYRSDLIDEFQKHRPSDQPYTPFCLYFNFPHNVLKAMVVDAMFRGEPSTLGLNGLLTGIPRDPESLNLRRALVTTLMGYARANPDTLRGRPVPVLIYDPFKGRRDFSKALRIIREYGGDSASPSA